MDKFVHKNLSINKVIHNLDKKLVEKRSYSQFDKVIVPVLAAFKISGIIKLLREILTVRVLTLWIKTKLKWKMSREKSLLFFFWE